jgi:phospholipid transport system transporter-binding protein
MSAAALAPQGSGRWRLDGALDFDSVADLWPQLAAAIADGGDMELSLAGVSETNSAGVVLLIEARGAARRNACRLAIRDIPQDLLDLARMSGCEALVVDAAA